MNVFMPIPGGMMVIKVDLVQQYARLNIRRYVPAPPDFYMLSWEEEIILTGLHLTVYPASLSLRGWTSTGSPFTIRIVNISPVAGFLGNNLVNIWHPISGADPTTFTLAHFAQVGSRESESQL